MPTPARCDVAVIGGGLIGLSSSVHLQNSGLSVMLIDEAHESSASTAAAGMLTPACEYDEWMPVQFLELLRTGLGYYEEFLSLMGISHVTVGFRRSDFTLLDLVEREKSLRERMEWMSRAGVDHEWLDAPQVSVFEPNLSPSAFNGAIRIRNEAVVNPILLKEALLQRFQAMGGVFKQRQVSGVDDAGHDLRLSLQGEESISAERVIVAGGAWSGSIAKAFGCDLALVPVKGQMVALRGPKHAVGSVIFMPSGGCGSVVERSPGEYVVGTSEEYLDPHTSNTASVISAILGRLCSVIPSASSWQIDRMWTGFRPMSSDELPIIDYLSDRRVVIATGHHRNGILLTPLTGALVANLLVNVGSLAEVDLSPYRVNRAMRPHARFADKY